MLKSPSHDPSFRLIRATDTIPAMDTLKNSHLQPLATNQENHYCPMCGQVYPRQNLLAEHMQMCHQPEMLFAATANLNYQRCANCHMGTLAAINGEFKCTHCGACPSLSQQIASLPLPNIMPHAQHTMSSYLEQQQNRFIAQQQLEHHIQHLQPQQELHSPHTPSDAGTSTDADLKVPPLTIKLGGAMDPKIKEEPSDGGEDIKPGFDENGMLLSAALGLPMTNQHNTSPDKIRHKCPECPRTFKTPTTLATHRKVHSGEADTTPKERPYTCSYCGKCFTQSNTLKQHTRIHTGEKPFRCGYCDRAFTVKDYLNKHVTTHTGEKPFNCTYCEKSFSVKDYLTKHIRTHTGEKPYACPYCDKRFTQRSALTVHTTKLHPM